MQGQGARDRREGPRQAVDEGAARPSGRHARSARRASVATRARPRDRGDRPPRGDRSRASARAAPRPRERGRRSRTRSTTRPDRSAQPPHARMRRAGSLEDHESHRNHAVRRARGAAPGRASRRPSPGAGEVLIRVAASGINRPDVLQRTGNYPVPPGASDLPGLEVAGEIVDGDAQAMAAAGLQVGDRVCALVAGGGYAELCVAPVGPVPAGARGPERRRGGLAAGDLLHRLEQRVRPRPPAAGRDAAGPGRHQRHRRHRDPAGQGAGRAA